MHCVLLYFVEVAEVMRRVQLCMLEAVEGRLCSLEAFVVSGMRRMPAPYAGCCGRRAQFRHRMP